MVNKKCSKLVRLAINAIMSGAVVVMGSGTTPSMDSLEVVNVPVHTPTHSVVITQPSVGGANVLSSQPQVEASCRNLWGLC